MLRNNHTRGIQTISNLTEAIANPASGDWMVFDIDETLLLTGINKYHDAPQLTESGLVAEIASRP